VLLISAAVPKALAMASESAYTVNTISATFSATFLLLLPLRLWKRRGSGFRRSVNWQGFTEAVGFPSLFSILFLKLMILGSWNIALNHTVVILDESFKSSCSAEA
jgi:hypothetical protein